MIEIWTEATKFNWTSQIISESLYRKGFFSNLEILELSGHVCREEYEQEVPTQVETRNTESLCT